MNVMILVSAVTVSDVLPVRFCDAVECVPVKRCICPEGVSRVPAQLKALNSFLIEEQITIGLDLHLAVMICYNFGEKSESDLIALIAPQNDQNHRERELDVASQ